MTRLEGAGVALAADVFGDGPPILLLHGGGQTRHAWGASGERIAALGWRAMAVDLRGHGESDRASDYAIDGFAADVRAIVRTLDTPPVIVGASLGGLCSLVAAAEDPRATIRGLVLVDVAHRANEAGLARIVAFMRANPDGFESPERAAEAVAAYLPHRAAPDSIEGLMRNLRRRGDRWFWHWDPRLLTGLTPSLGDDPRYLAAARAIEAPVYLVRGAISDVVSLEIAHELCALAPRVRFIDVADAGHMIVGDSNDRFMGAIAPILAEISRSGS